MNFFKSVFSDETNSPEPESESESESTPVTQNTDPAESWSFGGVLKTLTTKSESVIETYKRDLKEFGSGLKKEIETAHGSIGNITNSIDEISSSVLKSTAQMISQGKDSILAVDLESDSSESNVDRSVSVNSKGYYSRFENLVRGIQCDVSTYSEEIEDLEDYKKWKLGFDLGEKKEECESLISENSGMESIYKKLVGSGSVDEETFWCRYYYRVHKLKLAEDLRANIVKRAISTEEEDLSWDVDDEEDEAKGNVNESSDLGGEDDGKSARIAERSESEEMADEKSLQIVKIEPEEIVNVVKESKEVEVDNAGSEEVGVEKRKEETSSSKLDEERGVEGKEGSNGETSKDSDISVVSSHPSNAEEDDLGWDEIEDLSSIDEKKDEKRASGSSGSPSKVDFRKRLSAAEEEEDLSWDIEDDDDEDVRA